jgi:hypothetical protein
VATAGQHSRGGNQKNDSGSLETDCRHRNMIGAVWKQTADTEI